MSDKRSQFLEYVIDELNGAFHWLHELWNEKEVNKDCIIDCTNCAISFLRILQNGDHGALAEQIKALRDAHKDLEWSAAYARLDSFVDELE